jgi:hypothetical protein
MILLAAVRSLAGQGADRVDPESWGLEDVSRFPQFEYSMKDVKRAGEIIAG